MTGSHDEARFLALGDSYTIGEAVTDEERWPSQLVALLRGERARVADPIIIAKTGWTTDELSRGMDSAGLSGTHDFVSLLIGVNNQYRGRGVDEYRAEFRDLLRRATRLSGDRAERVVVISIPDWGVTPFANGRDRARIAAEIDAFNAAGREEASTRGVRYCDITAVSRRAAAEPGLLAADGLHPSGKMYAEWARLILPIARACFAQHDLG